MHGFGYGSHFVANLQNEFCYHCNNTAKKQCYATYSSQMMLGVTEYSYSGINLVCPICHQGSGIVFVPFNSRMGKLFGHSTEKQRRENTLIALNEMASQVDIPSTHKFYENLSWLKKQRYRSMLTQIQLKDLFDKVANKNQ